MFTGSFQGKQFAPLKVAGKGRRTAVVSQRAAEAAATTDTPSKSELSIKILTPEKEFYADLAKEIILPSNTGQIGILPQHAPLITALDVGVMLLRSPSTNAWTPLALFGGFALVQKNIVTILVNGAESSETVDKAEASKKFEEAKEAFEKSMGESEKQRVEANLALKRARAIYQLVE